MFFVWKPRSSGNLSLSIFETTRNHGVNACNAVQAVQHIFIFWVITPCREVCDWDIFLFFCPKHNSISSSFIWTSSFVNLFTINKISFENKHNPSDELEYSLSWARIKNLLGISHRNWGSQDQKWVEKWTNSMLVIYACQAIQTDLFILWIISIGFAYKNCLLEFHL